MTDYLEGALPAHERERVEFHLSGCDGCSEYLAQIRATVRTLGAIDEPPPDDETRERLLTMFRDLRA